MECRAFGIQQMATLLKQILSDQDIRDELRKMLFNDEKGENPQMVGGGNDTAQTFQEDILIKKDNNVSSSSSNMSHSSVPSYNIIFCPDEEEIKKYDGLHGKKYLKANSPENLFTLLENYRTVHRWLDKYADVPHDFRHKKDETSRLVTMIKEKHHEIKPLRFGDIEYLWQVSDIYAFALRYLRGQRKMSKRKSNVGAIKDQNKDAHKQDVECSYKNNNSEKSSIQTLESKTHDIQEMAILLKQMLGDQEAKEKLLRALFNDDGKVTSQKTDVSETRDVHLLSSFSSMSHSSIPSYKLIFCPDKEEIKKFGGLHGKNYLKERSPENLAILLENYRTVHKWIHKYEDVPHDFRYKLDETSRLVTMIKEKHHEISPLRFGDVEYLWQVPDIYAFALKYLQGQRQYSKRKSMSVSAKDENKDDIKQDIGCYHGINNNERSLIKLKLFDQLGKQNMYDKKVGDLSKRQRKRTMTEAEKRSADQTRNRQTFANSKHVAKGLATCDTQSIVDCLSFWDMETIVLKYTDMLDPRNMYPKLSSFYSNLKKSEPSFKLFASDSEDPGVTKMVECIALWLVTKRKVTFDRSKEQLGIDDVLIIS